MEPQIEHFNWGIIGELVARFGSAGAVAIAFAWAIWKGKLRPDREFKEAEQRFEELRVDRDFWRDHALRAGGLLERTIEVARTTPMATPPASHGADDHSRRER